MKNRKASLTFIFITILVDVIGIGIIIPVIPSLIEKLSGDGLSEASRIGGWLIFAFAIMQFLFAPLMGILSDKFGRRPVLLLSLLGLGIDYLFHAYAPTIGWLLVGRVLAGITGASLTVANAYIADISTPENKAQNFGMVGAAFGLGFIIGPVIGGIAGEINVQYPFFISAGLTFLNFIYGFVVLPESLAPEKRRNIDLKRANPIGSLKLIRKYPIVLGLIASFFLLYLASQAVQTTWTYYSMYKFAWDEAMVGYSLGVVGIIVAVVQGGLVKYAVKWWGEKKTIYRGYFLWIVGLVLFAAASQGWMLFAFLLPYCLGGIASPTLQGVVSNQVADNEQGELQGALTATMSLSAIIGPLIMTNLFYVFTQENTPIQFPGAPFVLGAILVLISFLLSRKSLDKLF
ncbi:TCR/Tet family MFS transporter [Acidiluteibacter ferrifornacis]|uniref:MFS transporter n=1 Tax=Acidiluteibacter ferrifornacis TaxID=2692424 RepID=A0A6N9NPN0_9FLAO|nr:TCR/Tet family MFS transporter [Acidiluteibacter ferrifornacis]NBG67077.1 MFS transporter [Acidiluteibacter ferrifornacis]